jgi:hypothetical protein
MTRPDADGAEVRGRRRRRAEQYGRAFHRPLAISVAGLMLAGVGLAVTALVLAVTHRQTAQALAYIPVAIGLTGVAVMVLRGTRWVIRIIIVVLAGQLAAIAGTTWELSHRIDARKAGQLRQLGFDPTAGVVLNLIYSSIGFALFCWFAARWLAARRRQIKYFRILPTSREPSGDEIHPDGET